jgi:hypothetical protein
LTSQTNYWHQILVSGSDVAETSILLEKPDHRSWSKMQIPRHSRRAALNAPPGLSFVCYHFFFFFEMWSHYIAQADLELTVLLPQLLNCWDYRPAPLCPGIGCFF